MKYNDLISLTNFVNAYLNSGENSKASVKLVKIWDKLKHHLDEYNELIADLRLDHASVDGNGNLVVDKDSNYMFSKDGAKKLRQAVTGLGNYELSNFSPINIVNPDGLDKLIFLKGWVTGIEFIQQEEEIL